MVSREQRCRCCLCIKYPDGYAEYDVADSSYRAESGVPKSRGSIGFISTLTPVPGAVSAAVAVRVLRWLQAAACAANVAFRTAAVPRHQTALSIVGWWPSLWCTTFWITRLRISAWLSSRPHVQSGSSRRVAAVACHYATRLDRDGGRLAKTRDSPVLITKQSQYNKIDDTSSTE